MYHPPLDHAWIFAARLIVVDIVVIIFSRSFSGSWLEINFEFGDTIVFYVLVHRIAEGLEGIKSGMFFAIYFSPELVLHQTRSTSNSNGFLHLHHPH